MKPRPHRRKHFFGPLAFASALSALAAGCAQSTPVAAARPYTRDGADLVIPGPLVTEIAGDQPERFNPEYARNDGRLAVLADETYPREIWPSDPAPSIYWQRIITVPTRTSDSFLFFTPAPYRWR